MTAPAATALIDAIAVAIAQALAAHGVSPADGNPTVHARCMALCQTFGGEAHWLPKTYRKGRDAAVMDAVRHGARLGEAARRAGIDPDTARAIVKRQSPGLGRDEWVL